MKFLVPNYSCLQIPVLSVLCPQLNLSNPPPTKKNSWVRHWNQLTSFHEKLFSSTTFPPSPQKANFPLILYVLYM